MALPAANGDKAALRQVHEIDAQADVLLREQAVYVQAQAEVERQRDEQQAKAEEQERQARRRQAKTLADAALALSAEADEQLLKLRHLLDRRADVLAQLARFDVPAASALAKKYIVTAAAHRAGLARHIEIGHTAPANASSLTAAANALRSVNAA